ncbi:myosin-2 heavy chain, non muscle-like [Ptychodera flava]|uniref:myosin-2 heavy chain, non muscle-like n=1 Tax=Ptychodera flava TaxID=63121 RepID=UPI003969CD58
MLLNFLSILGLYRFKSSVQTGRFAELYEPWLITDEMREIAAKVNLPLKLQVTYDKKKFDELDAFFIERDGRIPDFSRNLHGEREYRFEKQPQSKLLVEHSALPLSKLGTDKEDKLVVEDLQHTGSQRDQQTQGQVLKVQPSKAREGKDPLEKQYQETLKEVAKANEDDQLENTMREMNEVMEQLEKARKEAEVFKSQLDEVKEGKLFSDKLNKERLEEIGKAVEVATKKAIEITSLKTKIQDLETKLAESSDFVTNLKAKLSDSERNLAESRGLVIKLQAQLSDLENKDKDIDSNPIKDEFDKAEKENAHLKDQLDKATKVVTQLEDQLEIVVEEKSQIQEELDKERGANVLLGAGKQTGDLERDVKEKSDSGGMFSKLRKFVTGDSASNTEPKPIGTKRYIGQKKKLDGRHGGHKWTLQILGSDESGTEPGQFNEPKGLAWHGDQLVICDTENHRIQILNKNKVVIEIIRFDGQFKKKFKPWDVAISPDGHFFITDIGNNQIIICDQNKKIIQIIPQSADIEVRSITVMAAFIFVTDSKGKSLIKYNIKDGKLVQESVIDSVIHTL